MSIAAWKGFIQLVTNPFYWEKTEHGLHQGGAAPAAARVPRAEGGPPPMSPGRAAADPQAAAAPERELATPVGGR
jgi:hypothetical protein